MAVGLKNFVDDTYLTSKLDLNYMIEICEFKKRQLLIVPTIENGEELCIRVF